MQLRKNILLGGSAISAMLLGAASALAATPVDLGPLTPPIGPISSNTLTPGAPTTGVPVDSAPVYSDASALPLCAVNCADGSQQGVVTSTQTVSTDYTDSGVYGGSFLGNPLSGGYNAGATVSGTESSTTTNVSEPDGLGGFNAYGPYTTPFTSNGDETVSNVSLNANIKTDVTGMLSGSVSSTSNGDNTASLDASLGVVTTYGIVYANATGTATFDPATGKTTTTLDTIDGAALGADGLLVGHADSTGGYFTTVTADGVTTTGDVSADSLNAAIAVNTPLVQNTSGSLLLQGNGASYVQVNADDVTIHGGTSSTTVTVNNSGITVNDTTNGQTFALDNTGNGTFAGNVGAVDGNFSGNVGVGGNLTVTGTSDLQGAISNSTGNVSVNDNLDVTGDLAVTGNTTLTGLLTANGGIDMGTGSISDSSGNVTINDSLDVLGNVNAVGGNFTGNVNVEGVIYNNLSNTVTVQDGIQVNGLINGGNTAGANVIGGSSATSSKLAAGTSYVTVNQSNVTIHGGTSSTNVVVDDNGVNIASTPGGGNLQINSDGSISSSSANYSGAVAVSDNFRVTGNSQLDGSLTVNNGASIANGLTVTSGGANVTGNSTFNNNLTVSGGTTTNGIANVSGNITNTGNYTTTNGNITTTNGTVTGASLVSTGGASVATNLTVGGNYSTTNGNITTTNGNITATNGRIQAGTVTVNAGGSNKISGLANATLSATSTDAVTGQQLYATNQSLAALDAREAAHFDLLSRRSKKAYQGVAMGFASNAAPLSLANGESGISGGVGTFEGEWAAAIRAQVVTDSGVGFGANVGVSKSAVGGGVGASIKF